jgi:hypothetical protein
MAEHGAAQLALEASQRELAEARELVAEATDAAAAAVSLKDPF